jgi:hypothetical protein
MMSDPDNTSSEASPFKKQKSSDNMSPEDNNQENFFYQEIFYQGIICKLINILLSSY